MTPQTERRGLAPEAYEPIPWEDYPPYVSKSAAPREFSLRAAIAGCLFGILFGAANAYLGLRVGLTISTSIPIAVLTVLAFLILPPFGRIGSILEANISQTVGSASSSLASGIIFTIPALYLWGRDPDLMQLVVVAVTGGLLGVLFMVPLRRALIRNEHGRLPYPEGTACAEVLVAADRGGSESWPIFKGILAGGAVKFLGNALHLWREIFAFRVPPLPKAEIGLDTGPALLGVGYILGLRIATVMVSGALLASLVLIPGLAIWGAERAVPLYPETALLIRDMSPDQMWNRYVRYIGAGAVACGGILSLLQALPTIWDSARRGFREFRRRLRGGGATVERTDTDLEMPVVLGGALLVVLFLALVPYVLGFLDSLAARLVSAGLIALFAFFFVTVSSRIVGLVGVTSNPTSGMTISTLLGTSGLFLLLGWRGPEAMAQAIVIGAVVAVAASIAGDTSQDLKSGFLLGATPRRQQIGELLGVVTAVTFVCLAVVVLGKTYGFGTKELAAPQATLMKIVVEGVLSQTIPWALVLIGVGIALAAAALRVPVLAFAVGIYLPVSTMTPLFVGGLVRRLVERRCRDDRAVLVRRRERGILFGSGLVAGEGLVGVGVAVFALIARRRPEGLGAEWAGPLEPWVPLLVFALMCWLLARTTRLRKAA
ncbi:MAG: OPT family oligopeptide transporter [Acidobacteriota bacterium]